MTRPGRGPDLTDCSGEAAADGAAIAATAPAQARPLAIAALRIPRHVLPTPRHATRRSHGARSLPRLRPRRARRRAGASLPKLHKRLVKRPAFHWLEPPASPIGTITVAEVRRAADPREDERVVRRWGADIW